ncbi:MAG: extracellular solute-binding protein [Acidimicrobiales bacterium]
MTRARGGAAVAMFVAALGVALVATACGSSQPEAPTTVLKVVMTDDWVTAPFIDAVREFERLHPDAQIAIERSAIGRMSDVVRAGISSGAPPDVIQGHATTGAGQGLAQPVDDLWAKYKLSPDEFLPGAVEDVTWGGKRYGVPLDSNAMALFYDIDMFRAAGVSPPTPTMTFGDFEQMARALTSADGTRRAIAVPIDSWVSYGWIRANDGELVQVGEDGRPRFSLDSPRVVETISFLDRLVDARVAFGPASPDTGSRDAYGLFKAEATAMYASGSWDLVRLRKEAGGRNIGVALMPGGVTGTTEGTVMGGSSMWIPKGAKQRDLAFEFMKLVSSDPYAIRFATTEGRLPVRPRLFDDPHFQQTPLNVFVKQLQSAHPPILGALAEAAKAYTDALTQVFKNNRDPAEELQRAQARAVASLSPP